MNGRRPLWELLNGQQQQHTVGLYKAIKMAATRNAETTIQPSVVTSVFLHVCTLYKVHTWRGEPYAGCGMIDRTISDP